MGILWTKHWILLELKYMKNKKLEKAIDTILEDLKKNCISKEHRKAEINISCPECEFRLLESYLEWYKDLLEWK